ncbi:MAG: hypothetical protein R2853_06960 [Thermomicrobiales bacterium]
MGRRTSFAITREQTWAITAASVVLFVVLNWLFADGMFGMPLWNAEEWISSPIITYVMIALIILAGWRQATSLPAQGITMRLGGGEVTPGQVEDPLIWRLLLGNVFVALFWIPIRFFVGREWLTAGLHKITDPGWMDGGASLQGYWTNAAAIPEGAVRRLPTTGSASSSSTCWTTSGTRGSRSLSPWAKCSSGSGSSSGRWSGLPPSSAR